MTGLQGKQWPQGSPKEKESAMNMLRTLMFIDPGRRVSMDTGETVGGRGRGKAEPGKGENGEEWDSEGGAGHLT